MGVIKIKKPKGCVVRIWHSDREVLESIKRWFEGDFNQEVIDTFNIAQHPGIAVADAAGKRWCLRQEWMGNLNLTGWMAHFGPQLEEMDISGDLAYLPSLLIGFELVF